MSSHVLRKSTHPNLNAAAIAHFWIPSCHRHQFCLKCLELANGSYPHSRQMGGPWTWCVKNCYSTASLSFFAVIRVRLLFLRGTGWEFHFSSETPREKKRDFSLWGASTQNISLLLMMMTSASRVFFCAELVRNFTEIVNVACMKSKILWPRIVNNQSSWPLCNNTHADINFNTDFWCENLEFLIIIDQNPNIFRVT